MFVVTLVVNNKNWGLVLSDQPESFLTYTDARAEVDRLYKECSSDQQVVATFITVSKNGKIEIVYSSVAQSRFTCPVCHENAEAQKADCGPIKGKWFVYCKTCYARTGFYDTKDEAISAWTKLTGGAS